MSDPMAEPEVSPPAKANTKAKKTKKARQPAAAPKPKLSFAEQLGDDLANGLLVKNPDPQALKKSLNLIDRVTYVKLPAAAATNHNRANTIEEDVTALSPTLSQAPSDGSGSTTCVETSSTESVQEKEKSTKKTREVFNLNDFTALASLQELIAQYGRVSHMGILDKSYTFFITKDRTAALYYKVKNKVAVVGGDPLCPPSLFRHILSEFEKFRKKEGLGITFMGAGEIFTQYCRKEKWTTMCFATERVLNPMTNPVLHSNAGKSITRISRNLLDPKKEGLTLHSYTPLLGKNVELQQQLVDVYEAWRENRNMDNTRAQAYITVYDPFALPELMTYIYTKDRSGVPNGFAALRILGADKGYHLDPYVASPGAPRGVSELLLYGAMALLNTAKVSYLSLGYEPLDDLGEIHGMHSSMANISRKVHKRIFQGLHVAGKKAFHDKFYPDESQQSYLYLVFPPGIPSLRQMSGIVHVANIKMREALFGIGVKKENKPTQDKADSSETSRESSFDKPASKSTISLLRKKSLDLTKFRSNEKLPTISNIIIPRKSQEFTRPKTSQDAPDLPPLPTLLISTASQDRVPTLAIPNPKKKFIIPPMPTRAAPSIPMRPSTAAA